MEQSTGIEGWIGLAFLAMVSVVFISGGITTFRDRYRHVGLVIFSLGFLSLLLLIFGVLSLWGIQVDTETFSSAILGLMLMVTGGICLICLRIGFDLVAEKKMGWLLKLFLALISILVISIIANGLVWLLDAMITLLPSVTSPTFIRDALSVESWKKLALYFYLAITLPIGTYLLSQVPPHGIDESGRSAFSLQFFGSEWGLGGMSKWIAVVAATIGTLYYWAYCVDILFETNLISAFDWLDPVKQAATELAYLGPVLGFVLTFGFFIYVVISGRFYGWLIFLLVLFGVPLWWALATGYLNEMKAHLENLLELL